MQVIFRTLLVAACVAALPIASQAQTRKPAPKPAAKPAPNPAAKPVAKPAPAAPARTAAPAPAPAPSSAPAPARTAETTADVPFGVGTNAVNLGIGIGSRYGYGTGYSYLGGNSSVSPAISLSYERGIIPLGPGVLGVGGILAYQGASYEFGSGNKWKYTDIVVMVRGSSHYPVTKEFDAYGGVGIGVRNSRASFDGSGFAGFDSASATDVTSGLFVGGRYFFTESIGAFAELGYDQTYLKIGLSAKF